MTFSEHLYRSMQSECITDTFKCRCNINYRFISTSHPYCSFRHYFALPTNSGEQFYSFTSIAAWLLQMTGKHFEQPQEVSIKNQCYNIHILCMLIVFLTSDFCFILWLNMSGSYINFILKWRIHMKILVVRNNSICRITLKYLACLMDINTLAV